MKPQFLLTLIALGGGSLCAQVVPTTPKTFGKRSLGGGMDSDSSGIGLGSISGGTPAKPEPLIRHVTYFTMGPSRQWTSTDGRATIGTLIAFEEVEASADSKEIIAPVKPTIVKDDSVRLLVKGKAFVLSLDKLSEADRTYVTSVETARDQAATKEPAPATKPSEP